MILAPLLLSVLSFEARMAILDARLAMNRHEVWASAGTAAIVGGAALVSTYLPARAIARIDPSRSIRAL